MILILIDTDFLRVFFFVFPSSSIFSIKIRIFAALAADWRFRGLENAYRTNRQKYSSRARIRFTKNCLKIDDTPRLSNGSAFEPSKRRAFLVWLLFASSLRYRRPCLGYFHDLGQLRGFVSLFAFIRARHRFNPPPFSSRWRNARTIDSRNFRPILSGGKVG